jgi:hypothetical protein
MRMVEDEERSGVLWQAGWVAGTAMDNTGGDVCRVYY